MNRNESVAELSTDELEFEISSIVDQKIHREIEKRMEEFRRLIKYFFAGLFFLSGIILAFLAGFPGYVANVILNSEDVKHEVYSFGIDSLEDNKVKSKVFAAVKDEFMSGSDKEFREAIVNQDVRTEISNVFVKEKLPEIKLINIAGVKEELPEFTWNTLTNTDKKREKINKFLDDGEFMDALKELYYDKVLVLYEKAARFDRQEHIAILEKRGSEPEPVDIQGIGMEYDRKTSNCPNSIIDHKEMQAIIVLPNAKKMLGLAENSDIEDIQKLQFNHLRCNSSVFPYLTLKIKVRADQLAKDIKLVGVEIRDSHTSRQPLVRVTRAVSKKLGLPNANPNNMVEASGSLYIQEASYE